MIENNRSDTTISSNGNSGSVDIHLNDVRVAVGTCVVYNALPSTSAVQLVIAVDCFMRIHDATSILTALRKPRNFTATD